VSITSGHRTRDKFSPILPYLCTSGDRLSFAVNPSNPLVDSLKFHERQINRLNRMPCSFNKYKMPAEPVPQIKVITFPAQARKLLPTARQSFKNFSGLIKASNE
jgi:hypothetical protein